MAAALPHRSEATLALRATLEDMVAGAEHVVHGTVLRSWAQWDGQRQAIWTHYEILVQEELKAAPRVTVVVSEPGGTVDGLSMHVAGAPEYRAGEEVILLLQATPIGYLRTCGWGQGRYSVVEQGGGKIVRQGPVTAELVARDKTGGSVRRAGASQVPAAGVSLNEFKERLRGLVRASRSRGGAR
jgi:hypothetical protein